MQALQSPELLSSDSPAMDQLHDFLRRRRETCEPVEDFERFEQDLHRLFVAAEREALGHELARFDLDVPRVAIEGERYEWVLRCETTYNSAAGPGRVERSLYRSPSGGLRYVRWKFALGSSRATGPAWVPSRPRGPCPI